jgi:phosphoribosylglycinamide formyltransferase-1
LSERLPQGSRFAVLASGSGTNLQALLDAFPENLVVVAGDKKEAFAFERARLAGIPVEHVDPAGFVGKEDYDMELASRVEVHSGGCSRRSSSSASPPF